MWQKNGKGPLFKSTYLMDSRGGRTMILIGKRAGQLVSIEANSWQMLKAAGWKKV